ncbi:MAG TPA: transketolase, partial [Porphyromonadaceae bacterium]|nr:transketolase [Porphyromonadaceae bacterium]
MIFIWSHDAFRVGEDGPTHQPIEQEAQIRLMEQVKNHAGKSSMLVLRPCDAEETTVAWKMAVENKETPSALILSRQNIKNLPGDRKVEAFKAEKGAYIVTKDENPKVVLIANGSEVSTLVEASALLKQRDGIQVQIVAAPSEGKFREQSEQYQEEVIPSSLPAFGLTAGLPSTLRGLVGAKGKVWGLDHFGYSAPYKILDEKFGFTPENVYTQVKQLLSK